MALVSKEDWLKKGMEMLAKKGFQEVRIDRLCSHLKVSKGSFYHHFKNIAEYTEMLMQYWESHITKTTIDFANKGKTASEKMERLQRKVFENPVQLEVQIRAWSSFNNVVLEYLKKIDDKREQFMRDQYFELDFSKSSAAQLAALENTYYIGVITKLASASKAEQINEFVMFEKLLIDWIKPNLS